ncbi:MAG: methyltransferase domain-containing protein [Micropruina sp.]|uniref:class I SAM-dependent methyltransferase n=1 Tax=Micropruina sp. TaxID=2737536 RepID=UPI0039E54D40
MIYLHGHQEAVLRSHRSRTAQNSAAYLLPVLEPGHRLLDVGSGPGTITCDLAGLVADVVAIEPSEAALDLTREEATRRGVTTIDFQVADVHRLPFADDSFDVAHAHQVLQHLPDPVQALREMARVVRPGGYVAVRDSDYSGFLWHPASEALDDWLALYLRLAREAGGEPDAGRWYPTWASAAGLTDVRITSSNWCYTSAADRGWWAGMWADRVVGSDFAGRALASRVPEAELHRLSAGWTEWSGAETGLFLIPHVELLARIG